MIRMCPLGHLVPAVLDRGLVQLEMAGRVFLGEFDQLGDDLAAHLGAFFLTLSGQAVIEHTF